MPSPIYANTWFELPSATQLRQEVQNLYRRLSETDSLISSDITPYIQSLDFRLTNVESAISDVILISQNLDSRLTSVESVIPDVVLASNVNQSIDGTKTFVGHLSAYSPVSILGTTPSLSLRDNNNLELCRLASNQFGGLILSATDNIIFLRPLGADQTSGQVRISSASFTYDGHTIWHAGNRRSDADDDARYIRRDLTSAQSMVGSLEILPPESSYSAPLEFRYGYRIFVDNVGSGSDNTRLWIGTPNQGEVAIGPRTGADWLHRIRHRAITHRFESEDGVSIVYSSSETGTPGGYIQTDWLRGYLYSEDTRNTNSPPSDYRRGIRNEFKDRSVVGVPGSGTFVGLITVKPWQTTPGGRVYQIALGDDGPFFRRSSADHASWDSWQSLLEDRRIFFGVVLDTGSPSSPFPAGWSSTRTSTGSYTITHNLGTTNYMIVVTPLIGSAARITTVASRTSTATEVRCWNLSGNLVNNTFHFILIRG